jgi:hypothetical protein
MVHAPRATARWLEPCSGQCCISIPAAELLFVLAAAGAIPNGISSTAIRTNSRNTRAIAGQPPRSTK